LKQLININSGVKASRPSASYHVDSVLLFSFQLTLQGADPMPLSMQNRQRSVHIDTVKISKYVHRLMAYLGCNRQELSIVFSNDQFIRNLNRTYRQKDYPTNVLAFPQDQSEFDHPDTSLLGDIVVAAPTAAREAHALAQSVEDRLFYLIIHGLLHLLGYDHERSTEDRLAMEAREEEILKQFKQESPLQNAADHAVCQHLHPTKLQAPNDV
jgi:probable rRNA maturation factor